MSTPGSDSGSRKRRQLTGANDNSMNKENSLLDDLWEPPNELPSWEDLVAEVETVEKTSKGLILVYLIWYVSLWTSRN